MPPGVLGNWNLDRSGIITLVPPATSSPLFRVALNLQRLENLKFFSQVHYLLKPPLPTSRILILSNTPRFRSNQHKRKDALVGNLMLLFVTSPTLHSLHQLGSARKFFPHNNLQISTKHQRSIVHVICNPAGCPFFTSYLHVLHGGYHACP